MVEKLPRLAPGERRVSGTAVARQNARRSKKEPGWRNPEGFKETPARQKREGRPALFTAAAAARVVSEDFAARRKMATAGRHDAKAKIANVNARKEFFVVECPIIALWFGRHYKWASRYVQRFFLSALHRTVLDCKEWRLNIGAG